MVSSFEAKTQYMQRGSTIVQPAAGMRAKLCKASAKYIPACYEFGACRPECGESLAEICAAHTILQAYLLDNFKDVLKSGGVFLCFRAREPAANERHRRCRSLYAFVSWQLFTPRRSLFTICTPLAGDPNRSMDPLTTVRC